MPHRSGVWRGFSRPLPFDIDAGFAASRTCSRRGSRGSRAGVSCAGLAIHRTMNVFQWPTFCLLPGVRRSGLPSVFRLARRRSTKLRDGGILRRAGLRLDCRRGLLLRGAFHSLAGAGARRVRQHGLLRCARLLRWGDSGICFLRLLSPGTALECQANRPQDGGLHVKPHFHAAPRIEQCAQTFIVSRAAISVKRSVGVMAYLGRLLSHGLVPQQFDGYPPVGFGVEVGKPPFAVG